MTCAIAQSEEIQLINDRAALARDQARRSRRTAWADWIDPNPINILGNLLGGGRVGRRRVAIARLNLQAAALEARAAQERDTLRHNLTELNQRLDQTTRKLTLAQSRLDAHLSKILVLEVDYGLGNGNTAGMINQWQRTEELENNVRQLELERDSLQEQIIDFCSSDTSPNLG